MTRPILTKLEDGDSSYPHCRRQRSDSGDNQRMADNSDSALGRFLTLSDVAEVLSVSASEAMALVRSGELPAIRLGSIGQWRVEQRVLESFIADKYDESRRIALWNEAQYADVAELFADPRGQRRTSSS